ncbi:MAG: DUF1572 family protein [Bacteroidota bacterium]
MATFHSLFIQEVKRRLFEESIPRCKKCLDLLTEEEIWFRPNESSNSVGNLILHLCGNARQWIVAGFGKAPDVRERGSEFEERGPLPTAVLIHLLDSLQTDLNEVLDALTAEDLLQTWPVQVFEENGIAILTHVVEHFSYHTGQITYFVKARKDLDTAYYGDLKLEQ